MNPYPDRQQAVAAWKELAEMDPDTSELIELIALSLASCGFKAMDALHLAAAVDAEADVFLTTDHGILRTSIVDRPMQVVDPIDFLKQYGDRKK